VTLLPPRDDDQRTCRCVTVTVTVTMTVTVAAFGLAALVQLSLPELRVVAAATRCDRSMVLNDVLQHVRLVTVVA
jgi:hypothetical protein